VVFKRIKKKINKIKKKMSFKNAEIQNLEEQKLQLLANDPKNLVYRYVDREKVKEILPIPIVKQNIQELWKECQQLKTKNAAMSRQKICSDNVRWQNFSQTHPDIFDRVTHPDTKNEQILALYRMIELFEKEKQGKTRDGKQEFQNYLFDTFSMPEADYKRLNPDHEIRQVER
jgi:hypothetical protein